MEYGPHRGECSASHRPLSAGMCLFTWLDGAGTLWCCGQNRHCIRRRSVFSPGIIKQREQKEYWGSSTEPWEVGEYSLHLPASLTSPHRPLSFLPPSPLCMRRLISLSSCFLSKASSVTISQVSYNNVKHKTACCFVLYVFPNCSHICICSFPFHTSL